MSINQRLKYRYIVCICFMLMWLCRKNNKWCLCMLYKISQVILVYTYSSFCYDFPLFFLNKLKILNFNDFLQTLLSVTLFTGLNENEFSQESGFVICKSKSYFSRYYTFFFLLLLFFNCFGRIMVYSCNFFREWS